MHSRAVDTTRRVGGCLTVRLWVGGFHQGNPGDPIAQCPTSVFNRPQKGKGPPYSLCSKTHDCT